jgi:hypothetical protein
MRAEIAGLSFLRSRLLVFLIFELTIREQEQEHEHEKE